LDNRADRKISLKSIDNSLLISRNVQRSAPSLGSERHRIVYDRAAARPHSDAQLFVEAPHLREVSNGRDFIRRRRPAYRDLSLALSGII